jgi:hypothetical protein
MKFRFIQFFVHNFCTYEFVHIFFCLYSNNGLQVKIKEKYMTRKIKSPKKAACVWVECRRVMLVTKIVKKGKHHSWEQPSK